MVNVYIQIQKQNKTIDSKRLTFEDRETAMEEIEKLSSNQNYQQTSFCVNQNQESSIESYNVRFKRIV
ncbi:hypothetical protein H3010_gp12 [Bacillus phage BeachBum]|uniref:Uncharacterized protein n=1 Tax=Bacillus phage BeachBum TaxID=1983461 RepID=A0A1X9SGF4_9CAUD|nr:hypothetical protein H3010_gp12 [Bacillus phage BeachBum]ARQ95203.1 hypothetical protein BEACHBUM_12 [Bacillus phage BeachBum]